jgi:hypothetical protein
LRSVVADVLVQRPVRLVAVPRIDEERLARVAAHLQDRAGAGAEVGAVGRDRLADTTHPAGDVHLGRGLADVGDGGGDRGYAFDLVVVLLTLDAVVFDVADQLGRFTEKLKELQPGYWKEIQVHDVLWTAGDMLAIRLLNEVTDIFDKAKRRLLGDWYDVTPELASQALRLATDKTGVSTFTHAEMLDKVRAVRRRRIEAAIRNA